MKEIPAPDAANDALLVSAARDGDRAAFGHLYDRYARMVHGVLLARVPIDEVNDLVQDVFLVALRRLSTLRENERFGAWLATIARNRANDYYRHAQPHQQLEDGASDQDVEAGVVENQEDSALVILKSIQQLSEAYRETLILRLVEGMTGPEIATRTGMTHGSVRVNLHRGMQQLRAMLRSNAVSRTSQEEASNDG